MQAVASHSINAQVCYTVGDTVWAAGKDGTIQVYDATNGQFLNRIEFPPKDDELKYSDGVVERAVKAFVLVHHRLWAATASGDLLIFHAEEQRLVDRVRGPLGDVVCRRAALTSICFDGWHVLVGSEAGVILVVHPIRKQVVSQMRLLDPCTAVSHVDRFVLAGDRRGRLYVFDTDTSVCVATREDHRMAIQCILHEPASGTIWTGGKEGRLYSYRIGVDRGGGSTGTSPQSARRPLGNSPTPHSVGRNSSMLSPHLVVEDVGEVTSMDHVSGHIVLTTADKFILVIDPRTGKAISRTQAASGNGVLRGIVKVRQQGIASFWTYSHEMGPAIEWCVEGRDVPVNSPPPHFYPPNTTPIVQLQENEMTCFYADGDGEMEEEYRTPKKKNTTKEASYESNKQGNDEGERHSTPKNNNTDKDLDRPVNASEEKDALYQYLLGARRMSPSTCSYGFGISPHRVNSRLLYTESPVRGLKGEEERMKRVVAREAMREVMDEAQELRLKFISLQDALKARDIEIEKRKQREKELRAETAKIKQELIDITSSLNVAQAECTTLRQELTKTKDDLSQARTVSNNVLAEKSLLQAEISTVKIDKAYVEQQLRDAQNTVSGLRAENERLYRSIANMGGASEKERETEKQMQETVTESAAAVLQYKRLNRLLTSILSTMEYTIRRKEEEEHDFTCLLNAFRHRVVDRITDPHLTALMTATIVRNPARFSYSCDGALLAQLQDRSEPLEEFLKSLRRTDPNAYAKLIAYLQQSATVKLASPNASAVLDTFISLAVSAKELTDDAIASFRRSIPILFVSDSTETPSAPPGSSPLGGVKASSSMPISGGAPPPPPPPPPAVTGGGAPAPSTVTTAAASSSPSPAGAGPTSTMDTAREAKREEDITLNILRHFHSQLPLEAETMQKEQQVFEFILNTRRGLVDQLVHLFHRLNTAHMACETLTAPTFMGGGGATGGGTAVSPSVSLGGNAHMNSQLITSISGELLGVVEGLVRHFMTPEERIRLGVSQIV